MGADPAAHEAHQTPLAQRLVDDAIAGWLTRRTATALAAAGDPAQAAGIDDLRGRLDDYWYTLTPVILDALRRAGQIPARTQVGPGRDGRI